MNKNKGVGHSRRILQLVLTVVFSLALLLGIEYIVMTGNIREQSYRTATVLADQIENVLKSKIGRAHV